MLVVLLVTSIKEGYEDLQRSRSDKFENTRIVKIIKLVNGEFVETLTESQYIKSGDIVKLEGKSPVPADLLLFLTSTYEDGNQCYVETANIDGETNLKVREAPPSLTPLCRNGILNRELFSGKIECEQPNKDIHSFIGALHIESLNDPIPLSGDNILLRGALFCNTDWAYAVAIYTGQETKVQMNNRKADSKLSKIEGYLNRAIIIIFFAQIVVVCFSVISIYCLGYQNASNIPYIATNGKSTQSIMPLWLEQWLVTIF